MPEDLIVIGGGEHARVVIEAARSKFYLWNVIGFIDPQLCNDTVSRLAIARLGDKEEAVLNYPNAAIVLGIGSIGSTKLRERVVNSMRSFPNRFGIIVHEKATISPTATIGPGTVVMAGAVINSGATIGNNVIINSGSIIEHDVHIGDFTHVSPGAIIGGGTSVGSHCHIGLGAKIRDHVTLGDRTFVAMGAVVATSFSADACVMGIPARARAPTHNATIGPSKVTTSAIG